MLDLGLAPAMVISVSAACSALKGTHKPFRSDLCIVGGSRRIFVPCTPQRLFASSRLQPTPWQQQLQTTT